MASGLMGADGDCGNSAARVEVGDGEAVVAPVVETGARDCGDECWWSRVGVGEAVVARGLRNSGGIGRRVLVVEVGNGEAVAAANRDRGSRCWIGGTSAGCRGRNWGRQ